MNTIETYRYTPNTALRTAYEAMRLCIELFNECPTKNAEAIAKRAEFLKSRRAEIHEINNAKVDHLAVSVLDGAHRYVFPCGDSDPTVTEYWYEADDGETDEELDEYCDSMRIEIRSPYDCTGKRFTWHIGWKRTPYGIRFIHTTALDI